MEKEGKRAIIALGGTASLAATSFAAKLLLSDMIVPDSYAIMLLCFGGIGVCATAILGYREWCLPEIKTSKVLASPLPSAYDLERQKLKVVDDQRKPVSEAIAYMVTKRWGDEPLVAVNEMQAHDALETMFRNFEQAAYDGKFRVWGSPYSPGSQPEPLVVEVPREHWQDYHLDPLDSAFRDAKTTHRRFQKHDLANRGFADLKVSALEFERIWPGA